MSLRARLHIETELRDGRTVLKYSFASQPFKLADITENRTGNCLQLMLMNSSPGILDGDEYDCEITIGAHSCLQLQSQSYQRLFAMKNGARQVFNISLFTGSSLVFIPHPVVPHKKSHFRSVNNIYLQSGCTLVWGEILSCGRVENEEVCLFTSYHNTTQIFLNSKLIVKENILLEPESTNLLSVGHLEGFTHQASLIFINESLVLEDLANLILETLGQEENIVFGLSKLQVNGFVVRILGRKAEQLYSLLYAVSKIVNPINQKTEIQLNVA